MFIQQDLQLAPENIEKTLQHSLNHLRQMHQAHPYPDYHHRLTHLKTLKKLILENKQAIADALNQDFTQRHATETDITEVFPAVSQIHYHCQHLKKWMASKTQRVSLWFQPGRAYQIKQPLGVVGIIVPWNFPLYLSIGPLTAALAAGNRVMIKMSELTPHFGYLLEKLIEQYFSKDTIQVFNGNVDVAKAFSSLAFDHLFFTGSSNVGKQVMRAASQHLTPVTLELGGKSPALISEHYPLAPACESLFSGKLLNCGQICIAPDYLLLPSTKLAEFIEQAKSTVNKLYPNMETNQQYTHIINQQHAERLQRYLTDAKNKGAQIVELGQASKHPQAMQPYLLTNVDEHMLVMQEEIFGPILPIMTYDKIEQAIDYINSKARPLALYYFDHDKKHIKHLLKKTISGGVTINDTLLHVAQDNLPFGGVGNSGIGQYHSEEGFNAFSHTKSVFKQSRLRTSRLLYPPFGKLAHLLLKLMIR